MICTGAGKRCPISDGVALPNLCMSILFFADDASSTPPRDRGRTARSGNRRAVAVRVRNDGRMANGIRIRHRDHEPRVDESAYIAPTATLIGDVVIGPRAR